MSARRAPSLAELRRLYLGAGAATAPAKVLRSLALDPRASARELRLRLERRRDEKRAEELRLTALLNFERVLWKTGIHHVAGVDEVGIGPLAGPVVAAAVVLPPDIDVPDIDDSKRLDEATRERLDRAIRARAVAVAVAEVSVAEIDRINVYHAGLEAMRRAVLGLVPRPKHVLVDAREIPGIGGIAQNAFDRGDGLNYSIACASIVAKVHRDRRMSELASAHPGYGFERHKGYGTADHMAALARLGPSPIHRRSFPVLQQILGAAPPAFYELRAAIDGAESLAALDEVRRRLRAESAGLDQDSARKLLTLLGRRTRKLSRRE